MKLKMSHAFEGCTPERLWEVFLSPEFDAKLKESSGVDREVLERREEDGEIYIRRRVVSDRKVPAVMAKALGVDQIAYEQESRYKPSEGVLRWTITPEVMPDRISVAGTTRIVEKGGRCERIIEGDINIRIALVGKRMEKKLAANIQETYDKAAELAREMI